MIVKEGCLMRAAYSSGELVLIPMKVDSDSDLIPVTRSDGMPVTFGA